MRRVKGCRIALCLFSLLIVGLLASEAALANQACMEEMRNGGRKIGVDVDGERTDVWIVYPEREPLQELTDALYKCLDRSYPSKKITPNLSDAKNDLEIWYSSNGSAYDYCVDTVGPVGKLGGNGPKRNQYSTGIICRTNRSALPTTSYIESDDE